MFALHYIDWVKLSELGLIVQYLHLKRESIQCYLLQQWSSSLNVIMLAGCHRSQMAVTAWGQVFCYYLDNFAYLIGVIWPKVICRGWIVGHFSPALCQNELAKPLQRWLRNWNGLSYPNTSQPFFIIFIFLILVAINAKYLDCSLIFSNSNSRAYFNESVFSRIKPMKSSP